jgi:hypothetical protein
VHLAGRVGFDGEDPREMFDLHVESTRVAGPGRARRAEHRASWWSPPPARRPSRATRACTRERDRPTRGAGRALAVLPEQDDAGAAGARPLPPGRAPRRRARTLAPARPRRPRAQLHRRGGRLPRTGASHSSPRVGSASSTSATSRMPWWPRCSAAGPASATCSARSTAASAPSSGSWRAVRGCAAPAVPARAQAAVLGARLLERFAPPARAQAITPANRGDGRPLLVRGLQQGRARARLRSAAPRGNASRHGARSARRLHTS